MTTMWKKQWVRLCTVAVLSGALLWNVGALHAQDDGSEAIRSRLGIETPRVKLTRDEAAKNFVTLLRLLGSNDSSNLQEPDAAMMSSFSRKSENENLSGLLVRMITQWKQPNQTVKVQSESAGSAVVMVETNPQPATASRPLVLIHEEDSWGVDVEETYALWNGLQGAAKTEAFARLSAEANRARDNERRSSCQSNLKRIALAIAQYTQDYDEALPPAKSLVDVLQPYVKSEPLFKCPSVTDPKGYGYAYNSKLSNKQAGFITVPSQTVSVYETTVLKRNAYGMGENRALRHSDGSNYAFADGHVKWFNKSQTPTFNLKP